MLGARRRTNESPGDMEGKAAICVIREGGKKPNSMRSDEKATQGVQINAKVVISNVENDEPTTVYNDV